MSRHWMCSLGGWLLWGSLGALVAVIGVALALPFVVAASEAAGEVMLSVMKAAFALMAAAFLLGIACHLAEGLVGRLGEHRLR